MAGDVKVSDWAVRAALAEMQRWGIRPSYLLAAVRDAVQAAFEAQAAYDRTVEREEMFERWNSAVLPYIVKESWRQQEMAIFTGKGDYNNPRTLEEIEAERLQEEIEKAAREEEEEN